jgi:hypothetical protein
MRRPYATLEKYGILILFLLLMFFNRLFWAVIGPIINLFAGAILGRGFF